MTALEYAEELLSPVTEEHEAEARIIISELTALPINNHNFHSILRLVGTLDQLTMLSAF